MCPKEPSILGLAATAQCPLWVISEHDALVLSMSAFLWRAVLD
jgi:hypothetical protein